MSTTAGRLSPELVGLLAARGDVRRLERGEILIHEGELAETRPRGRYRKSAENCDRYFLHEGARSG